MAGTLTRGSVPDAGYAPPLLAPRSGAGASYMRGERSHAFQAWWPGLRDSRDDVRAGYVRAAARVIDSIHNSGWLAGAVNQAIASTIGTGLRLAAKPEPRLLGGQDAANAWAHDTEARFEDWSEAPLECDAEGRYTLAQLCAAGLRSYYSHGEILGLMQWIGRPGARSNTKLKLLPAHRLVQDSDDATGLYQGVRVDRDGRPAAYRIDIGAPGMPVEIETHDGAGRPRAFLIFDGEIGQVRGISPMTPALRVVRQFDSLSDATLTAALIQAIFAATVKSPAPTQEILSALQNETEQAATQGLSAGSIDDYLAATTGWYSQAKVDLYGAGGQGKIAHLFPGEELQFLRSEHPNGNFEPFARFLLREIARCLGMSVETLTGDYTSATYSSVRIATSEIWPITLWRRKHVAGRLYQTVYGCWLEEEIDAGRIPFPGGIDGFVANRHAACRAEWRGPAKPQADDLKTAKAHQVWMGLGVMSQQQVGAELGTDIEDTQEELAREAANRKRLKLPDPHFGQGGGRAADDEEDAPAGKGS